MARCSAKALKNQEPLLQMGRSRGTEIAHRPGAVCPLSRRFRIRAFRIASGTWSVSTARKED